MTSSPLQILEYQSSGIIKPRFWGRRLMQLSFALGLFSSFGLVYQFKLLPISGYWGHPIGDLYRQAKWYAAFSYIPHGNYPHPANHFVTTIYLSVAVYFVAILCERRIRAVTFLIPALWIAALLANYVHQCFGLYYWLYYSSSGLNPFM